MVKPGLYKHYKKGDYYRVLFSARYAGTRPLAVNEEVAIFVDPDAGNYVRDGAHLICCPLEELDFGRYLEVTRARNSSDGVPPELPIYVVYVSLYPSSGGRVSVREVNEFEGEGAPGVRRFELVPPNCHACSYAGMGPNDPYLVCGHPDAGVMGTFIKKEPLDHCPDFSKFEQHPGRNPDGTLSSINNLVGSASFEKR